MSNINSVNDLSQQNYCTCKRHELIADLDTLSDRQLQDFGLWRDAIPDTATRILAHQGCFARDDIQS